MRIQLNKFWILFWINSIILLVITPSRKTVAQNHISNPDFRFVAVTYEPNLHVRPQDWYSFENSGLRFSHPAKQCSLKQDSINNIAGLSGIHLGMVRPCEGIFMRLNMPLINGQIYTISIKLKNEPFVFRNNVNVFPGIQTYNWKRKPEKNWLADIAISFTDTLPTCKLDLRPYHALTLKFPKNVNPDSSQWFALDGNYKALGNETFFVIGMCKAWQYIDILRKKEQDTTDYDNKNSYYFISNVSITPYIPDYHVIELENPSSIIAHSEDIYIGKKFVFKNLEFKLNSFNLSEASKLILDEFALYLKSNHKIKIVISGHTDASGEKDYNQFLSEKRAITVFNYLLQKGVSDDRMCWQGFGCDMPLITNADEENAHVNRRVEFELLKY